MRQGICIFGNDIALRTVDKEKGEWRSFLYCQTKRAKQKLVFVSVRQLAESADNKEVNTDL